MLQVRFKHANGYFVDENELQDEDLSGGVLTVRRLNRNDNTAVNNTEFLRLSELLIQTTGKLQSVHVGAASEASPEYLTFLITACSKANGVEFVYSIMSDTVYACLMSSIMNPDGIKELSIKLRQQRVSVHHARLLFQGVASSSSLETLKMMWFEFEDMEDSVTALEHAFQRNRSLKSFSLYLRSLHSDFVLENIVGAAAGNATLQTLNITAPHNQQGVPRLSLSFLKDCLCRETCSIRKLKLEGMVLNGDLGDDSDMRRNSLLTNARFPFRANLTCSQAVRFAKSFNSLTHLYINLDPSSKLVPLDELLLGEESMLQDLTLVVESESGMAEQWADFFQKLPRMKSLKSLDVPRWIFRSESCRSAFLDALRRNNTISNMILSTFGCVDSEDEPSFPDLYCKMSYLLSLNRGGRQFLQNEQSEQPLARNLWPHVLERAMRIRYVSGYEISKYPKLGSLKIDVVYWLLRENLFT